jgi:rRNA maturation endonuclease Nob1
MLQLKLQTKRQVIGEAEADKEKSLFLTEQIPEEVRIAADIDEKDPDQMHLLRRTQDIPGLTPEQAMSLIKTFDITFTKRHVINLMDKFENHNADLALDVNKMEVELL